MKRKTSLKNKILYGVVIFVVLGIIGSINNKENSKASSNSHKVTTVTEAKSVDKQEEKKVEEKKVEEKKEESKKLNSKEFREYMDSYEKFMNSYVEFMKKYKDSNNSAVMAIEYFKLLKEYEEHTRRFETYDEENLSNEDYAYYLDVQNRITKKLLEIQ